MSLPRSLQFPGLKPEAIKAEVVRYAVPVANGSSPTVASGGTFSFNVAAGQRNHFLDPAGTYLRFKVTPTLTGGATPTCSAHAFDFIKSWTLASSEGQVQQEQINCYSVLMATLRDLCADPSSSKTKDTLMLNSDATRLRAPATISTSTGFEFVMPVLSCIGLLSGNDRLIPVCALSAPLRVDIVLNSALNALACTGTPTGVDYTVSNISLNVQYIKLTDGAMSAVHGMSNGAYQWTTSLWRDSSISHPAATASNVLQLNGSKVSFAKTLIAVQRPANAVEASAFYSNSDRVKNYLSTAQWSIGSTMINGVPLDCTNNAVGPYMEAQRAYSCSTSEDRPTLIDATSWVKQTSTTPSGTAVPGSFALIQELQSYPSQSGMMDGQNTMQNQPFLSIVYDSTQLASVAQATWNLYTECEAVATVSNGMLSIVA